MQGDWFQQISGFLEGGIASPGGPEVDVALRENLPTVLEVVSSTFHDNTANRGGGIALEASYFTALATVRNSTITENTVGDFVYQINDEAEGLSTASKILIDESTPGIVFDNTLDPTEVWEANSNGGGISLGDMVDPRQFVSPGPVLREFGYFGTDVDGVTVFPFLSHTTLLDNHHVDRFYLPTGLSEEAVSQSDLTEAQRVALVASAQAIIYSPNIGVSTPDAAFARDDDAGTWTPVTNVLPSTSDDPQSLATEFSVFGYSPTRSVSENGERGISPALTQYHTIDNADAFNAVQEIQQFAVGNSEQVFFAPDADPFNPNTPDGPLVDGGDLLYSLDYQIARADLVTGSNRIRFDQRGVGFNRIYVDAQGNVQHAIDIGSIELDATTNPLIGDYNLDGMVDAADYTVWRNAFNAQDLNNPTPVAIPGQGADGDLSGFIEVADYTLWKNNFEATTGRVLGDYDNNGLVDADDYLLWKEFFGAPVLVGGAGPDGDGDGEVNLADYTVWRDNFGNSASTGGVPSPSRRAPRRLRPRRQRRCRRLHPLAG